MALFGKKKTEEAKKDDKKSAKVESGKKAKKSMKDLYGAETKQVAGEKSAATVAVAQPEVKAVKQDLSAASAFRVLLKPLVTEKGSHLGIENKYPFVVGYHANKIEIAKAFTGIYGIKPLKVNVIKMAGKVKQRGRYTGRRKNWKKAIITLPEGKSIKIYEGI